MPDDRTTATELGTALGTLGLPDLDTTLSARPDALLLSEDQWDHVDRVHRSGRFDGCLAQAFANGRALLCAKGGLRGRLPQLVEWTGARRYPGDEAAPIDLRIDHVYLISCKYESAILANTSPARLFEGLLATSGNWLRGDWFELVAGPELKALFRSCTDAVGLNRLPPSPTECSRDELKRVRDALRERTYPDERSRAAYAELCQKVSTASANRWANRLIDSGLAHETMLWRLLRIGNAPYFLLGNDRRTGAAARYRIADPWDWRDRYRLDRFTVVAAAAGQPRVDWTAGYHDRHSGKSGSVEGHVEIRWSHGRFSGPPEAKVYLDSPMFELPGYHPLDPDVSGRQPVPLQPSLWESSATA
ncbi:MAG: hypothetical protein ACYCVN_08845 [Acidimicrobiales bacterium]